MEPPVPNDPPQGRKRRRRWGDVGGNDETTITTTTVNEGDSSNRILALQESVKARLLAAKQAQQQQPVPATNDKIVALQESVKARLLAAKQQQQAGNTKKAKVYELDLTITTPSFHQQPQQPDITATTNTTNDLAVPPISKSKSRTSSRWGNQQNQQVVITNPYLAHRIIPNTSNANDGAITTTATANNSNSISKSGLQNDQNDTDNSHKEEEDDTIYDATLFTRVERQRSRNKGFAFNEPGKWTEKADKIRSNQQKLQDAGFLSGRKKGHTVTSIQMDRIYGGGAGAGDLDAPDAHHQQLAYRADANPDKGNIISMPYIMEWWDMEMVPLKWKKQVKILEHEREYNTNTALTTAPKIKKTIAPSMTKEDQQLDDSRTDDHDMIIVDDANKSKSNNNNETDATMKNNDGNDDDYNNDKKEIYGDDQIQELRTICYEQASISYSKTFQLVQHIVPIEPKVPGGGGTSIVSKRNTTEMVLHLTKKEMKRQRKLRRQVKQQEQQDLQAAGLLPAPEPKLTLQNFLNVLGTNAAVTDPSAMEAMVRKQMEHRKQQHLDRNSTQKLSKEQRALKNRNKLSKLDAQAMVTQQITVAIFYVKDVTHPYHRTKIDKNVQQLNITGCVMECLYNGSANTVSCVIAEGNPQSIKRFIRLMTIRMKWTGPDNEDDDDDDDNNNDPTSDTMDVDDPNSVPPPQQRKFNPNNFCHLIWQGYTMKRNFINFIFQEYDTEPQVRKILKSRTVEQYWDRIIEYHNNKNTNNNMSNKLQLKLYKEADDDDDNITSYTNNRNDDDDNHNDNDDQDNKDKTYSSERNDMDYAHGSASD